MVVRYPVTDRESWLARRQFAVNASEAAALFGCHPYKSHYDLFMAKSGKAPLRRMDEVSLRRGRIFEEANGAAVREERPDWKITKATDYLFAALGHLTDDNPVGAGATPDFIVECPRRGRGLLQTKSVLPVIFEKEWTPETPPLWIVLQVQQEMMLEDVRWGAISALVTDPWQWPVHLYEFEAHPETQALLQQRIIEFWEAIAEGTVPTPDYARDGDLIKSLYPRENGLMLDLRGDNRMPELLSEHRIIKARMKLAAEDDKAMKAIEAEIKAKIGDASGAYGNGWEVRAPVVNRKAYQVEATSYRSLRIKIEDAA